MFTPAHVPERDCRHSDRRCRAAEFANAHECIQRSSWTDQKGRSASKADAQLSGVQQSCASPRSLSRITIGARPTKMRSRFSLSPCSSACMQAAVGLGTRQCAVGKVQESGQMEALVFPDLKIAAILGGRVCGIWLERQAGCRCNGHPFRRAAGAQGWPMRRLLTLGSAVVTVARRAARHEDAVAPRGFTNWCGTVPFWARCSGTAMVLSSRAAPCATQFGAGIQTDTRHPAMPYGACLGTPRRRTRIGRACCASAQPMRWTAAAHGARRE